MMVIIGYHPTHGQPVGDGNLDKELQDIRWTIAHENPHGVPWHYSYSTENMILAIRVAIVEGSLNCKDITFEFDGQEIQVYEDGDYDPYPKGFCDIMAHLSRRVMLGGSAIRIARRKNK